MKKFRVIQIQIATALVVVIILAITLVATVFAGLVDSQAATPTTAQASPLPSATMSLSQALGEEVPIVIVFTPVEQCSIQYCVTGELIAKRLGDEEISVVSAPVHTVPMDRGVNNLNHPFIDLGVYLVEPFIHWLPEFSEGEFGYGLDATAVVLIDVNGQVVTRHQHLVDVDGFVEEVIAYSTTRLFAHQ